MIKTIHIILSAFCLIFISCAKEKKQEPKHTKIKTTQSANPSLIDSDMEFQLSKIKNVCDCYSYSMAIFNEAISIRESYKDFDAYNKEKASVKKIKQLTKNWRKIRQHCLKTYEREMFTPNNCKYPSDSVEKIREKFYSLGFSPSY